MSVRVLIRKPTQTDCQELLALHHRSQEFHCPWVTPALNERDYQEYIDRCQQPDFEGLLICYVANDRYALTVEDWR